MDRAPKQAPFPVGTRLRYLGTMRVWADAEMRQPLRWPGMEVTVTETRPGRRGTLRQFYDEDGPMEDDNGDPIRDTTRDGYSVWVQANGHGLIIWPDAAHEWEVVTEVPAHV